MTVAYLALSLPPKERGGGARNIAWTDSAPPLRVVARPGRRIFLRSRRQIRPLVGRRVNSRHSCGKNSALPKTTSTDKPNRLPKATLAWWGRGGRHCTPSRSTSNFPIFTHGSVGPWNSLTAQNIRIFTKTTTPE